MKRYWTFLFLPVAAAALGGCHFPHLHNVSQPVGQVVATVEGHEITIRDLNAELAGVTVTDPKTRKAAEQYALRAIISRKILAAAAQAQGLDKTPDFAIQRDKAIESLLVQALAAKVAASVPQPSQEEIQTFITAHPDSFAERKIFTVDQIRVGQSLSPAVQAALKPLTTLDEIAALFDQDHVQYRRGTLDVDALSIDPKIVDQVVKLPAGSAFIVPSGGGTLAISTVKQAKVVPFTGQPASSYAMQFLRREHAQEAVNRAFGADLSKGATSVRYNKDYAPPPAKAPPASNAVAR